MLIFHMTVIFNYSCSLNITYALVLFINLRSRVFYHFYNIKYKVNYFILLLSQLINPFQRQHTLYKCCSDLVCRRRAPGDRARAPYEQIQKKKRPHTDLNSWSVKKNQYMFLYCNRLFLFLIRWVLHTRSREIYTYTRILHQLDGVSFFSVLYRHCAWQYQKKFHIAYFVIFVVDKK